MGEHDETPPPSAVRHGWKVGESLLKCIFAVHFRAISSVGSERSPHTRKVTGSNPVLPTPPKGPFPQKRPRPRSSLESGLFLASEWALFLCREAP